MVELEVEADADLISKVGGLALEYFGDTGDVSKGRVLEAAFQMRCLWPRLMERGKNEVAQPELAWEVESHPNNSGIYRMLLRGGQEDEEGHHHSEGL